MTATTVELGQWISGMAAIVAAIGLVLKFLSDKRKDDKAAGYNQRRLDQHEADILLTRTAQLKHFKDCDERQENHVRNGQILQNTSEEVQAMRRTQAWVGDCIMGIANEIKAVIPPRPL